MATEEFTDLPQASSAQLTDIICAVQGYVSPSNPGVSVQETLQQVSNLINANFILSSFSNPNGLIAGSLYQLCWDISDSLLYVCTAAGTSTTAVWRPCIGQLTNGQLRIGSTGLAPVASTLTAGDNIEISNSAGNITISSPGGVETFEWTVVSGTSAVGLTDNGYITNNVSLVTISLPAVAAVGDAFAIIGQGAGGWKISQSSGQQIHQGHSATTSGASGSLSSTNQYDSINLICTVANTVWTSFGAPQGNLTVV